MTTFAELAAAEGPDGSLCFALQREMLEVDVLARFSIDGDPVSKQRPRFARSRGKVYTPGGTKTAEEKVGWAFRASPTTTYDPAAGTFGVHLGFFCAGGQRRDLDNMIKLVLDGLNRIAWADDSQVTEASAKLARFHSDPRTEVVIYRTITQTHPENTCERCGTKFPIYNSNSGRRYCSKDCQYPALHLTCAGCGGMFRVKPSKAAMGQVNCSTECRKKLAAANLVQYVCGQCSQPFTLRLSEARRQPGRRFCSVECRAASQTGEDT